MKYKPVQPPEGINVTPEHPLKSFFVLTAGTIGLILIVVAILGFAADYIVGFIPVEYEQSLFSKEKIYFVPFPEDNSTEAQTIQRYIQSLVDQLHILAGDEFSNHKFNVAVADTDEPNAFAAPGSHIVVTKGLFQSVESENGLCMVLAHEMAHHYKRHPLRSTGRGLVIGLFLLALIGADGSSLTQQVLGQTVSIGILAFSRKQEAAADTFAVELLIKHYGHASGAAEFFQYIQNRVLDVANVPSFLNTHPSTEDRIDILTNLEELHPGNKIPLPKFVHNYLKTTVDE